MEINAGKILEVFSWLGFFVSALLVVGMIVGILANKRFDEFGQRKTSKLDRSI